MKYTALLCLVPLYICCTDNLRGLADRKVENVVITSVTSTSVGLSWDRIEESRYHVFVHDSLNHYYHDQYENDTFAIVSNLEPGTMYNFVVCAIPIAEGPSSQPSDDLWQRTLPEQQ